MYQLSFWTSLTGSGIELILTLIHFFIQRGLDVFMAFSCCTHISFQLWSFFFLFIFLNLFIKATTALFEPSFPFLLVGSSVFPTASEIVF